MVSTPDRVENWQGQRFSGSRESRVLDMSEDEFHQSMSCLEFRRALYVDGGNSAEEFLEHLNTCPACAKAAAQAWRLEHRLRKSMTGIPVPETLAARIMLRQSFLVSEQSRRRKFVLAIAVAVCG